MPQQPGLNPIGVHALVWAGDTLRESVELAARRTMECGFDLLELSLHDLDRLDVAHARDTLERSGLQVACSRGLAFTADVSSEDSAVVERGAKLLHDSLEASAKLGARTLTGALYSALGKYNHPLRDRGRRNAVAVLRDLAKEAAGQGVTLGLEICNRYETNVVNTARQALDLADDIGEGNVVIHLDTYHMNIEEDDLVRPVYEVGDRLGYVHIGESHRGFLGTGSIDFAAIFDALTAIGYGDDLSFESFSSEIVDENLSKKTAIWRNLWTDNMELARHARRFIAVGLETARRKAELVAAPQKP